VNGFQDKCPRHPANAAWNCPDCDADAVTPDAVPDLAAAVRAEYRTRTRRTPRPEPTPDRTRIEQIREQMPYCDRGPCSNLAGHEGECSL